MYAQLKNVRISVLDHISKKDIEDCNLVIKGNKNYYYLIQKEILVQLDTGKYSIVLSQINYKPSLQKIQITKDTTIAILLESISKELLEIEIKDSSIHETAKFSSDASIITTKYIKKIPNLVGEADIYKFVQQLPGVAITGEGSGSLHVRGGEANENLILLDDSPIYEPNHILGLVSVFDADYIADAHLLKNGVATRYGGRLSSVLKFNSKTAHFLKPNFNVGIGVLSSKFYTNIPIIKNKLAITLNVRKSNIEYILGLARPHLKDLKENNLDFYDFNTKISFQQGKWNSFLSMYIGKDALFINKQINLTWGNTNFNFKTIYKNKNFQYGFQVGFSQFQFNLDVSDKDKNFFWKCAIADIHAKTFSIFKIWNNSMEIGLDYSFKNINPTQYEPLDKTSIFKPLNLPTYKTIELSPYFDYNYNFGKKLGLNVGLRVPNFFQVGSYTRYIYKNEKELTQPEIVDTINYATNQLFNHKIRLEPRINVTYKLAENITLNSSYNRNYQFINQIITGVTPLPISFWMPSIDYFEPAMIDKFSSGIMYQINESVFLNMDLFYNYKSDILDFVDNADLFLNKNYLTQIRKGTGRSYGMELSIAKNIGRFTGSLAYTLSSSTRQTEDVNQNRTYYANSDRRNILNVWLSYRLSPKFTLGLSFNYATGRPITLPSGVYQFQDYTVNLVSDRNGYRMPDFHHLDLNLTYKPVWKRHPNIKSTWNLNIYNVYNRKNAFLVYSKSTFDGNNEQSFGIENTNQIFMLYLFSILPSIRYTLEF